MDAPRFSPGVGGAFADIHYLMPYYQGAELESLLMSPEMEEIVFTIDFDKMYSRPRGAYALYVHFVMFGTMKIVAFCIRLVE